MRIDLTEWRSTMRQYMVHTKKDLATVLNEKAYRICWGAFNRTHRAEAGRIRSALMQQVTATRADGSTGQAPLAGVLAQKLAKSRTGSGHKTRSDLRRAVRGFVGRRVAATAFMRSGWLQSIESFARALGKPLRRDKFSKNRNRGGGLVARPSWRPSATLYNSALAKRTSNTGSLEQFAGKALREAIAAEVASMRTYIERKLQQTANRYARR